MEQDLFQETLKVQGEKKKIILNKFLEWNRVSREEMKKSKIILDKLFHRIDQNLKKSETRFRFVKNFFEKMQFQIRSKIDLQSQIHQFEVSNKVVRDGKEEVVKNEKFKDCIEAFNKDYSSFNQSLKMTEKRIENQIIQKIYIERVKADLKVIEQKCQ